MWRVAAGAALGALVGAVIGAARLGSAADSVSLSKKHDARVLLIGDSHGVGLMAPLAVEASARSVPFSAKFGKYVEGSPLPYDTSVVGGMGAIYFGGNRITSLLRAYNPTVVLISLGGNDYQRTWDADRVAASVNNIVTAVRVVGATPVWLESPPLPFPDKIGVGQMWVGAGALRAPGGALDLPHVSDNVHLTRAGYAEWARIIWAWLEEQVLV